MTLFSSLPPELVAQVCSNADTSDLQALSATTASIRAFARLALLDRHGISLSDIMEGDVQLAVDQYALLPVIAHIAPIRRLTLRPASVYGRRHGSELAAVLQSLESPVLCVDVSNAVAARVFYSARDIADLVVGCVPSGQQSGIVVFAMPMGLYVSRRRVRPLAWRWELSRDWEPWVPETIISVLLFALFCLMAGVVLNVSLLLVWMHDCACGVMWDDRERLAHDLQVQSQKGCLRKRSGFLSTADEVDGLVRIQLLQSSDNGLIPVLIFEDVFCTVLLHHHRTITHQQLSAIRNAVVHVSS
ncbi:unnamed protein product [Mycena citricolor]|uniref:F-box domain-containing protein n=1 Tax=Mycena citricolor TaxID=2018698 RepID=A0AAD2JXD9_9AGAR|nr:unnamed protein product [Mycena citricolor]